MKRLSLTAFFLILTCLSLTACGGAASSTEPTATAQDTLDYACSVTPEQTDATAKTEATVKTFVDGDTVHFYVPEDVIPGGVLKARFLAIDTPESTGKVEPYGKKASAFTEAALSSASSILLESDTDSWNLDSTGSRYLTWVWYQPAPDQPYRNLNIELLQLGLAQGSNAAGNRYGESCTAALLQAKAEAQSLFSGEDDPDYRYAGPLELTLKELREDLEGYSGEKVAVSGIITANSGKNGVYVESIDEETGIPYGIFVFYGYNLPGQALDALAVGNETRIVGTLQYYKAGQSWQIAGLSYKMMQPDDPENVRKLSQGHSPAYTLTSGETFASGTAGALPYAQAVLATSIRMEGLTVTEISVSDSGTTLTCQQDGFPILLRTAFLVENADSLPGAVIDVNGIVDEYAGNYLIQVFLPENLTIY